MKHGITLLAIEDSMDDFLLLKYALDSSDEIDVEIIHEDRLVGAIEAASKKKIDAAVIDLSLPDSFGLDTFVSFHQKHPLVPTIIMTGDKDHDIAVEAIQLGAQDYLFKGEPSATAIVRTIRYAIERQRLTTELKTALEHVKQLQGMLPICSSCKKIRDDKGYWNRLEEYFHEHSNLQFSHGICPDCVQKLYPGLIDKNRRLT